MASPSSAYEALLTIAADRAVPSLKGLKGRARRNAEILRSNAMQAMCMRICTMTDPELQAELEAETLRSALPRNFSRRTACTLESAVLNQET